MELLTQDKSRNRTMWRQAAFHPVDGPPIPIHGLKAVGIVEVGSSRIAFVETFDPNSFAAFRLGRIGRFEATEFHARNVEEPVARHAIGMAVVTCLSRHAASHRELVGGIVVLVQLQPDPGDR